MSTLARDSPFALRSRWSRSRLVHVTEFLRNDERRRIPARFKCRCTTDGPMNTADVAQGTVAPVSVGGFSFFELFLQAHPVVKLVMIGLLLASIWSWAIIVEKLFAFRRARVESDKFETMFWSGQSLDELYASLSRGRTITMAALFVAAMREWKRSVEGNIRALGGIQLRVEKVMDVTISRKRWNASTGACFFSRQLDRRHRSSACSAPSGAS